MVMEGNYTRTLFAALRRLYPRQYQDGKDDFSVARIVRDWANAEPKAFGDDLVKRGRNPDTETLLRSFGADDTKIEQMFTPQQRVAKAMGTPSG